MPNAWHRKIKVTARTGDNGAVKFDEPSDLTFRNKVKNDYHLVTFYLNEKDGVDLKFDATNPMWVGIAPTPYMCPPAGSQHADFKPLFVSPSGKELTAVNLNSSVLKLGFALNFVNQADGNPVQLDPIADNKNGGSEETQLIGDFETAILIGGGVILLGGLIYLSMQ